MSRSPRNNNGGDVIKVMRSIDLSKCFISPGQRLPTPGLFVRFTSLEAMGKQKIISQGPNCVWVPRERNYSMNLCANEAVDNLTQMIFSCRGGNDPFQQSRISRNQLSDVLAGTRHSGWESTLSGQTRVQVVSSF